jgi:hypothetical protein
MTTSKLPDNRRIQASKSARAQEAPTNASIRAPSGHTKGNTRRSLLHVKDNFHTILEKNHGFIYKTCVEVGITLATYYNWLNDQEFADRSSTVEYKCVEQAVSRLREHIYDDGNVTALIYYLNKKGYVVGMGERGGRTRVNLLRRCKTATDISETVTDLISQVASGAVSIDDGNALIELLEIKRKFIMTEEIDQRLKHLENQHGLIIPIEG